MRTLRALLAGAAVSAVTLVGSAVPSIGAPTRSLPPANGQFDYQIGGSYTPAHSVAIVDRDRHDPPVRGKYNICYINAFQSQPDEAAWWKRSHPNMLLRKANGSYVVDAAWGEILLDTSTTAKRALLIAIVGTWIDGCRRAGFQAVEPDNLDSYSRSYGRLTRSENVAFAKLLAARAHAVGLAIAQKNDTSIAPLRHTIGFDFAIVEECQVYSECNSFLAAYGNQVYEIEYSDNGGLANFLRACKARGARISVTYRDRDVVPKGTKEYVYRSC